MSKLRGTVSFPIILTVSRGLVFLIRFSGNSDATVMVFSCLILFSSSGLLEASKDFTIVSFSTSNAVNEGFWIVSVLIIVTAGGSFIVVNASVPGWDIITALDNGSVFDINCGDTETTVTGFGAAIGATIVDGNVRGVKGCYRKFQIFKSIIGIRYQKNFKSLVT